MSRPPASRPTAAPPMLIAAYTPIARLRGGPSGKVVVTRDSAAGATMAPPTPWIARAASSQACVVANPPSSEASREQQDAGDEHPAPAEDVPGPAAEQQQPAEGQGVGVDDPLQAGAGEAERGLDVRQRDVHDRRVEHHHQLRGGDDDERQAEMALGGPGRGHSGLGPRARSRIVRWTWDLLAEGRSSPAPWRMICQARRSCETELRWPNGFAVTTRGPLLGNGPA